SAEYICPVSTAGRKDVPVTRVSWMDVQIFLRWLNRKTHGEYRLPSESEFEYAARAGTQTRYWWGDEAGNGHANCAKCGARIGRTSAVGMFPPNPYGLYDILGNVWQWTDDCWSTTLQKIPGDGKAAKEGDCGFRVVRGGSWFSSPANIRLASRIALDKSF